MAGGFRERRTQSAGSGRTPTTLLILLLTIPVIASVLLSSCGLLWPAAPNVPLISIDTLRADYLSS